MSARSGAIRAVYLVFALIGLSCAAGSQLNLLTTQQEIGHVVGKHGARKISKQYGLAVLVELAVGGENPSLQPGPQSCGPGCSDGRRSHIVQIWERC